MSLPITESQISHPKYRPDIDGLRAVAVLAVVFFHAFPSLIKGGFIGVDVFFVISGYLISTIIFENLDRDTFSFAEFYSRRIKRIFPALILVLVTSFVFGWFVLLADEYKQLGKHVAAGASFFSNIILWNEAGYFDTSSEVKPLLHLWSLGIEEQFYIVFPLLLWLAWKQKINYFLIIIIIIAASFMLNFINVEQDIVAAFYSPQTRFWELLFGSLLAYATLYKKNTQQIALWQLSNLLTTMFRLKILDISKYLADIFSFLGCLLLIYGFYKIDKKIGFPGMWAIIPVFGASLIIFAGPSAWFNRVILSNKFVVWFGLISFPLYLWHWPLLVFARILEGGASNIQTRIFIVLFSILLAWLTYRFIENPIRKKTNFNTTNNKSIIFGLGIVSVFICSCGYLVYKSEGLPSRKMVRSFEDFNYPIDIKNYNTCSINEFKSNNITLNYCLTHSFKPHTAAIIGDSHAEDKFRGLIAVDKKDNWMLLGNSSCPPVLGISVEGDQKNCEEKFKLIFNYLINEKNIKNVILSFYGNYFKLDAYSADHLKNNFGPNTVKITSNENFDKNRGDMFFYGLDNAIKLLISNGKNVTLFVDIPELPFFPKDCFRNTFKNCNLQKSEVMIRQDDLRNIVLKLKKANPNMNVFDPINLFCTDTNCNYKNSDVIYYRDSHHLSQRGSNLYAKQFLGAQ